MQFIRGYLLIITTTLLFTSCLFRGYNSNTSTPKEMQKVALNSEIEIPQFRLKRAGKFPHKSFLRSEKKLENLDPSASTSLDIRFGKLSEAQFKSLKLIYPAESTLQYVANKDYTLLDFLPRYIQATADHKFAGHFFRRDGDKFVPLTIPNGMTPSKALENAEGNYVGEIFSNCWGSVYEYARNNADGFSVFYGENKMAHALLSDNSYSSEISVNNLMPGDVLLIIKDTKKIKTLEHAAVYIDDNVYFEKTGTDDTHLYHLTRYEDMNINYEENYYKKIYRRFNKEKLPDPEVAFKVYDPGLPSGISVQTDLGRSRLEGRYQIKYQLNTDGTYKMSPEAYSRNVFDDVFVKNGTGIDPDFFTPAYQVACIMDNICLEYKNLNKAQLVDLKRYQNCKSLLENSICSNEKALGHCDAPILDGGANGPVRTVMYENAGSKLSISKQQMAAEKQCLAMDENWEWEWFPINNK